MDLKDNKYDILGFGRLDGFLVVPSFYSHPDPSDKLIEEANSTARCSLWCICIVTSLFTLPLSYLVFIQSQNVLQGSTTYLRFSRHRREMNR